MVGRKFTAAERRRGSGLSKEKIREPHIFIHTESEGGYRWHRVPKRNIVDCRGPYQHSTFAAVGSGHPRSDSLCVCCGR